MFAPGRGESAMSPLPALQSACMLMYYRFLAVGVYSTRNRTRGEIYA